MFERFLSSGHGFIPYVSCPYGNCESLGGHLVTVTSAGEQDAMTGLMASGTKNNSWPGGYKDSGWKWITGELFSYSSRSPGEPNHCLGHETSLRIYRTPNPMAGGSGFGKWNDLNSDGTCNGEPFFGVQNFGLLCERESAEDSRR